MVKLKLFNKRNATHLRRRNFQVAEEIKKIKKKPSKERQGHERVLTSQTITTGL